jgi:arylformamidase
VSRVIDISMPVREGMPFWPGNPPFRRVVTHVLGKDGSPVNQTRLEMGSHCGTHVDAPLHFEADGYAMESVPPEHLLGPVRVLHFPAQDCVDEKDLAGLDWTGVERVLFRTRNSDHWARGGAFDEKFCYVSPAAARFLAARKLKLVGIDSLGIEQFGSKDFGAHHALLRNGITILEGLVLVDAAPGDYTLFCGPLRIPGNEGAPARAFLLS